MLTIDILTDPSGFLFQNINCCKLVELIIIRIKDLSAVDLGISCQDPHNGLHNNRFSGTGFTDDSYGLATLQVKVDPADGVDRSGIGFESEI